MLIHLYGYTFRMTREFEEKINFLIKIRDNFQITQKKTFIDDFTEHQNKLLRINILLCNFYEINI